jgi:hypothetical protein
MYGREVAEEAFYPGALVASGVAGSRQMYTS